MKTKLVVSRKWNKPEIEAFISKQEIGASIDINTFLDAVVEEVGNPTMMMTKAALRAKLQSATDAVLKELRDATRYVA